MEKKKLLMKMKKENNMGTEKFVEKCKRLSLTTLTDAQKKQTKR